MCVRLCRDSLVYGSICEIEDVAMSGNAWLVVSMKRRAVVVIH